MPPTVSNTKEFRSNSATDGIGAGDALVSRQPKPLQEAEERVLQVVRRSRAPVQRLIETLEREETLELGQIEACLGPRPAPAPAGR
jgi:hypothetical protein